MVVIHGFQDIIDSLPQKDSFSLPLMKQNSLKIDFTKDDSIINNTYSGSKPPLPFANSEVYQASIIQWRRLTALQGDCKAVYEVTFDVEDSKFNFKAGDTIGVIPHNDESDVNCVISHLNLFSTADLGYSLYLDNTVKGGKISPHIPVRSTLRHVLTHCVDLRSVLKKLFLLALSKYTEDEKERKLLEYLCSKEGSPAYLTHILNKNICLLDIFTNFKSCRPPIEVILANLPRLLPRPYSIVNSGLNNDELLKICFSVITMNNKRKGLTSGLLEKIILNDDLSLENQIKNLSLSIEFGGKLRVPIYLRKNMSMFTLPENLEIPLILIGPGTGVAPFIGFLEEREHLKLYNKNLKLGDVWLFFGCRNPELDFIYEEELNAFLLKGTLKKLCTAFSRVDNDFKYIQDSLTHHGKEVTKLIRDGASVYICGDLKTMVTEVKEVLIKCLVEHDSMSLEDAQNKISELQKDKRFLVDAWS